VLALALSPGGFSVAQLTAKVQAMTGQTDRTRPSRSHNKAPRNIEA
jgi:hypothetical protein